MYDRDNYGPDYNSYDRDDAHYHHARNLTNEFEQEYRSHHEMDRERYMRDRDRGSMRRSYHEGDMGDAYERLQEGRGAVRSNTSYNMIYGERDMDSRDDNRSRNQNWGNSGSYSGRYNEPYEDYSRNRDMHNRDRYSGQERRGGMEENRGGRMYNQDRMRQSSPYADRGITSSFSDDYGSSERGGSFSSGTYGTSAGNYSGYGPMGSSNRRSSDRRDMYDSERF